MRDHAPLGNPGTIVKDDNGETAGVTPVLYILEGKVYHIRSEHYCPEGDTHKAINKVHKN